MATLWLFLIMIAVPLDIASIHVPSLPDGSDVAKEAMARMFVEKGCE